jgi:hypothetical protein
VVERRDDQKKKEKKGRKCLPASRRLTLSARPLPLPRRSDRTPHA